ncbi:MAG TPA: hypothetical protein VFM25_14960 [Verrucomicrobiae bacterium]|nr:hypothetical protein [Verrucomicrobiae bacterium]
MRLVHQPVHAARAIEQGILGVQMQMNKVSVRHETILTSNAEDTKRQSFGIIRGVIFSDETSDRDDNPRSLSQKLFVLPHRNKSHTETALKGNENCQKLFGEFRRTVARSQCRKKVIPENNSPDPHPDFHKIESRPPNRRARTGE